MPTSVIKCLPNWIPSNEIGSGLWVPQIATTLAIAGWLPEILCRAINEVDGIAQGHPDEAKAANVEIDFVPKHGQAINAVPLHIVAHPPEIDADFEIRRLRRTKIRQIVFDELWRRLNANNDHLIIPKWEIEVIPVETSGYGCDGHGKVLYSWGNS